MSKRNRSTPVVTNPAAHVPPAAPAVEQPPAPAEAVEPGPAPEAPVTTGEATSAAPPDAADATPAAQDEEGTEAQRHEGTKGEDESGGVDVAASGPSDAQAAMDPATVAMLQEEIKPGDVIVAGDEPDLSDGITLEVETVEDDGTIVASPAEPERPSIDSVMRGLKPASVGAVLTRPEVYLTGEQAELQNRLYLTLSDQGVTLRSQGDVYGWMLGQMLEHLNGD